MSCCSCPCHKDGGWKELNKYQVHSVLKLLTEAYEAATLKKADFSTKWSDDPDLPTAMKDVTAFIQKKVSLHHRTWVLRPLNEAIELLKGA